MKEKIKNKNNDIWFQIKAELQKRKFCVAIIILIPILIWLCYFVGDNCFILINTSLTVGDALGFYAALLSFIGTVVLGVVAVWQNKQATEISKQLLQNELVTNSCVIDFDDDIETPVSIKDYTDGSGKGLYIIFKNYGNIDIINYSCMVHFLNPSTGSILGAIEGYEPFKPGAFLRNGGTNSITVRLPTLQNNILQLRLDFNFTTRANTSFNQSLLAQFIICNGNVLDMREKYIFFYNEEATTDDKT